MIEFSPILAAKDDVGTVLFFVVMAIIWGISGLMSWLRKQQQKAKTEEQWREILEQQGQEAPPQYGQPPDSPDVPQPHRDIPGQTRPLPQQQRRPVPPRLPSPQNRPGPRPMNAGPVSKRTPPPLHRATPRRQVPVVTRIEDATIITEAPASSAPMSTPLSVAAKTETRKRESSAATATRNALTTWLRPATLRRQYILTEILQPPLALRGERERIL